MPQENDKVTVKVVQVARRYLAGLSHRKEYSFSFSYDSKGEDPAVTTVSKKSAQFIYENSLEERINALRLAVQSTILKDAIDQDTFDKSMIVLALKGREFFDNVLTNEKIYDGPIQIIANRKDYFPLEHVYTYPPPSDKAKICPNASASLKENSINCKNCLDVNSDDECDLYCPLGFIGLRNEIERFDAYDKNDLLEAQKDIALVFEPLPGKEKIKAFKNTLMGHSGKVDKEDTQVSTRIFNSLKKASDSIEQATTWNQWKDLVGSKKPDTLLLIVHTQSVGKDLKEIEIGNDLIIKERLSKSYLAPVEPKQAPVVILIGCNTTDVKTTGFDFSAHFINKGAAIVLSNFTKITGRKAGRVINKMLEFIEQNEGKEMSLSTIVLKIKQHLINERILAGLTLVAHGDADWKLQL